MLADIKTECKKIEELRDKLIEMLSTCEQYISSNLNEFYDETGISLQEIDNYILYLKSNLLEPGNKDKLLEFQRKLKKAIKRAANLHILLASKHLQGKKVDLTSKGKIIVSNYDVPYINGLFEKIIDVQKYYKANLSYIPEHMRFKSFDKLNYLLYSKQLNLLADEYTRKIADIESRRLFKE